MWDGDTVCKQCHQDQIDQKISPLRIKIQEFPCPLHGHPGRLNADESAWVSFYEVVAPYSREGALDHVLISKICEAEQIDFMTAFEWLTFIHQILLKAQDENEGIRQSSEEDAS